ncbi:MAG: GntR family transcriptional regulator [Nitrospirota bacterium]
MIEIISREYPQRLYFQLREIMKKKIEKNEWEVGSQIPTEEELCKIYGVSRSTVRSAISELVREGYLTCQQGKGTFVKKQMSDELSMLTSFRELMLETGVSFSTEILAQTTMMPMGNLSAILNIPPDKHTIYIKRLTVVGGKPVIIQELHIPLYVCPQLLKEDIVNNSLFGLFKKYKINISLIKNNFGVTQVSPTDAKLFGLAKGSPVLLLEQIFFSGETQVMYMRSIKRPDSFGLSIEFKKSSINDRRFYVKR